MLVGFSTPGFVVHRRHLTSSSHFLGLPQIRGPTCLHDADVDEEELTEKLEEADKVQNEGQKPEALEDEGAAAGWVSWQCEEESFWKWGWIQCKDGWRGAIGDQPRRMTSSHKSRRRTRNGRKMSKKLTSPRVATNGRS